MPQVVSLLLVLSLFLRGFGINHVPPELFGDELDVGYQAYSLLKTGQDLYRTPLPFYINSLSEPRAPVLIYATVPSITALGLTDLGVRLPEVIFGSLAPVLLFLLVYQLSKNKLLSVFCSLALVFMPWHILYSRAAFEVVLLVDFLMLGSLLYLKRFYSLSLTFFILTFYTYSTAVIFTPLLLLVVLLHTKKLPSVTSLILSLLLISPFVINIASGKAGSRFSMISIFNSPKVIEDVQYLRNQRPSPLEPLFHNRYQELGRTFLNNYLRAFSVDFLFVQGDPILRHSVGVSGQLLLLTAPFVVLGLLYLASNRQLFWLGWLLIAPLASALTADGAHHATRLFLMVPPLAVATGTGLYWLGQTIYSKFRLLLLPLLFLLLSLNFTWVTHHYLTHYPKDSWRWWHQGFKPIFKDLKLQEGSFRYVFINNTYEPSLVRFLFYTSYSPATFHRQFTLDKPIKDIVPGYEGFRLGDRYYFGDFTAKDVGQWIAQLRSDSLYVVSQRDDIPGDWDWRTSPPSGVKVLATSVDPHNFPILYLITRHEISQ